MMRLSELFSVLDAQLIGCDTAFLSVGTDSRHIEQAQLFVAIKGENFDGNEYATQALAQGAAAVLISDATLTRHIKSGLLVKDTRLALGLLAQYWRQKFDIPLIAITGSNGKTTVKEMTAAILSVATANAEAVLATKGNFNNDIGMPLTLLKLNASHQFAVIEMGMNHTGELEYLTRLALPNIALVNNAGTAHIGELGSQYAIAQAKGEIFSGLGADGVAIINADDAYADYWKSLNSGRNTVTFGLSQSANQGADITATTTERNGLTQVNLSTPQGNITFDLNVLGAHNVRNALAASAVAFALNISLGDIAKGLTKFAGVSGRLTRCAGINGAVVIDDTYNANPDSMRVAIDVLTAQAGDTMMVMGDMGELGTDAAKLHAEIGSYAKKSGVKAFYTLGDMSVEANKAFGEAVNEMPINKQHAQHFASVDSLAQALESAMDSKTVVLVKGSRFMKMERVVNQIIKQEQEASSMVKHMTSQGAH